jgi:hypothetical protein
MLFIVMVVACVDPKLGTRVRVEDMLVLTFGLVCGLDGSRDARLRFCCIRGGGDARTPMLSTVVVVAKLDTKLDARVEGT